LESLVSAPRRFLVQECREPRPIAAAVQIDGRTPTMVFSGHLDNSPPLPVLPSFASFNLSTSGSFQTHLSSFNSEQRLRNLPSVVQDLEKQADNNSDCSDDGLSDDVRQTSPKQRFLWLVRTFVWFSALFFPISALGNYGFLSRRQSVNPMSGGYESGSRKRPKIRVSTEWSVRPPSLPVGKRETAV
jgi:hypothetical protein